jgi:type IV secretory pathway TraG/TraD family ATPase VirD4
MKQDNQYREDKERLAALIKQLQAHSSYVVVDPKGQVAEQVGSFLMSKQGYKVKVFNSIDFTKSIH